jgi:hypothetical protein
VLFPEDDDREDLEVALVEDLEAGRDWYLDSEVDVLVRYVVGELSEDLYLLFTSLLLYFTSLFLLVFL